METSSNKTDSATDKPAKVRKCAGKDTFERMNYLYQASNALATENEASNTASVLYSNLVIAVSKKAVQRLDVDMKRTICKGCRSLLFAGINCKVRIKKKRLTWTCTTCCTRKVFDYSNCNQKLWTQQSESVVEVLDYQNNL